MTTAEIIGLCVLVVTTAGFIWGIVRYVRDAGRLAVFAEIGEGWIISGGTYRTVAVTVINKGNRPVTLVALKRKIASDRAWRVVQLPRTDFLPQKVEGKTPVKFPEMSLDDWTSLEEVEYVGVEIETGRVYKSRRWPFRETGHAR